MKKNIGSTDKIIRLVIAAIAIILIVAGVAKGVLAIVLGVVAAAMLLTSLFGFCALYTIIGYSSCPAKK